MSVSSGALSLSLSQCRGSSHGVKDNLEDDIKEEYVMNPLLFNNLIDYLDEEHVHRCCFKPSRKSNNDRLALFYTKLFYNDYLSRTLVFDDASFHKVFYMRRDIFLVKAQCNL